MKKLITIAAVIASLTFTPAANATPADQVGTLVCEIIDDNPAPATIGALGGYLVSQGISAKDAATAIVLSVQEYCPRNWPLLQKYINSGRGTSAA